MTGHAKQAKPKNQITKADKKQLHDLFKQEDLTYFAQGDLLLKINPDDELMKELCQEFNRSSSTLRERMKVARMVPPDQRDPDTPWTVYREACRIKSNDDRAKILKRHPRRQRPWTLGEMQSRVQTKLESYYGDRASGNTPNKAGFRVNGITGRVELDAGLLTIDLGGDLTDGHVVKVGKDHTQITFKVVQ